ncbi:MBL fold metallo-hydrolase [Sphingomonas sp. CGMCC 1.13654]|uniref:MBL fold metallo-hydrolase n=1 Tax=Sphingomonas chungangi TaxID=2683589 RepID=A0A838L9B3_9SPHN|nr:MBL fold metallo-hydrolase [Sphingomonas chungangi]MBA2934108.1 MBL fold metallo-hydrolase [Sphingomonas chungangi]
MLIWIGRLGAGLLVLVLLAVLAMALAPRFLDRIYYRGPASDHFDGERFFNPGERPSGDRRGFSFFRFLRFAFGMDRAPWPKRVPVAQAVPPSRVEGQDMRATWIGHATVLVQTQGLNILTDPVWSERASPFGFMGPKRVADAGVAFGDLPKIDVVLLSHNHYDHLDLATLERLWKRDRPLIVTPLGNDTILRTRGIEAVARDWGERVAIRPGIEVIVERVHHWGSRWGADRDRALWGGLTVTLPGGNLFFAGDTGWGDGSWTLGVAANGPHRLALIPIGAYLPRELMRGSHVGPDEAVAIFRAIGAERALGIHWGTFQLSEEGIEAPAAILAEEIGSAGFAADRFRTMAPGGVWEVPRLGT